MSSMYCKSAGLTAYCGTCKHNPANQPGQSMGRPISPPCRNGKCPHFVMLLGYGVRK